MSLTPEQATIILHGVGIPTFKAEYPVTKRVIAAIPADKANYQPDAVSKSAIDLAWHIVVAENRFMSGVIAGEFDLTPSVRPDHINTPDAVNEWYAERFQKNLEALQRMTGEQLIKRIDFRGLFQFPAVVYVNVGVNHSIHHRGQLSMYLRPVGAKVPSIYGESYDAREAREAAQRAQTVQA
jgi:uncharacterized damage-inducible protein DinB